MLIEGRIQSHWRLHWSIHLISHDLTIFFLCFCLGLIMVSEYLKVHYIGLLPTSCMHLLVKWFGSLYFFYFTCHIKALSLFDFTRILLTFCSYALYTTKSDKSFICYPTCYVKSLHRFILTHKSIIKYLTHSKKHSNFHIDLCTFDFCLWNIRIIG